MAAVGPPQQQVRMARQQAWAALEVALRVPCLYIIDAIFNSYYDSGQSRLCVGLQVFLRLLEDSVVVSFRIHGVHIMVKGLQETTTKRERERFER